MIRSMTGFARIEHQTPSARLVWELRAVNSRYLDLLLKLPEEFRPLEAEIRNLANSKVARGKLELGLRYSLDPSAQGGLSLDHSRLAAVREALDQVTASLGASTAADPVRVLSFPGVMKQDSFDFAPLQAEAMAALEKAMAEFNRSREREGARMAEHINERAASLSALLELVWVRAPQVRDAWLGKLKSKCAELGVEVEPQRLAQELAIAAQKLDVDEEITRLGSHLKELATAMKAKDAVGRRLDFLMQEFNREVNTIGSKSQDAEMTKHVVEMKVVIEQMREQVQNLE